MKLLRNPVIVGILAVVAVVMVVYQVVGPKAVKALFGSKPAPAPAATTVPAAAKPAAPVAVAPRPMPVIPAATFTNLEAALEPGLNIDTNVVEQKFSYWVRSPLRDPFLLLAPVVRDPGLLEEQTNSPVSSWVLQAIWNQTDTKLAVINEAVYAVGDIVAEGYKLIRIEMDEVWFQGPYRNERLGFREPKKIAPKVPPATAQNSRVAKKL